MNTPASAGTFPGVRSTNGYAQREPRWDLAFFGVLLYIFIEYTRLPAMFPVLVNLQVAKIAAGIAAVGLIFASRAGARRGWVLAPMDVPMVAFFGVAFFSACFADFGPATWSSLGEAIKWGAVYFLFGRILTNHWRLRVAIFLMLLLNVKIAQFGIRTYLYGRDIGLSEEFLARGVGAGVTGFYANSNDFGAAMCVIWPLAGALAFAEPKKMIRFLLWGAFGLILLAVLLSASRGAMVAAFMASLVAFRKSPKKIAAAAMLALLLVAGSFFLPDAHKQRLRAALEWESDANASSRIALWRAGWRMFLDHPILGVGTGNFSRQYAHRYGEQIGDMSPERWAPHSIYVQSFAELGTVGGVAFLFLVVGAFRVNSRTRQHLESSGAREAAPFEYYLATGLDLALVAFLVSGAFLTILYYPHLWILLGLTAGLHNASLAKRPQEERSEAAALAATARAIDVVRGPARAVASKSPMSSRGGFSVSYRR